MHLKHMTVIPSYQTGNSSTAEQNIQLLEQEKNATITIKTIDTKSERTLLKCFAEWREQCQAEINVRQLDAFQQV